LAVRALLLLHAAVSGWFIRRAGKTASADGPGASEPQPEH
jgi:hypothetical protein